MAVLETKSVTDPISPSDLRMLSRILEVWCNQHHIPKSNATHEAKLLLRSFYSGKRSQIELIDALVNTRH
jgi:hypothetical protein